MNKDGASSLKIAAQTGNIEFVKLFVEHEADINAVDEFGYTVLHEIADCNIKVSLRIVEELLKGKQSPATLDCKTNNGETAADIAKRREKHKLYNFLEKQATNSETNDANPSQTTDNAHTESSSTSGNIHDYWNYT